MKHQNIYWEFQNQTQIGKKELVNKNYKTAFYHFENAHVLGQKNLWRHTISHCWMFIVGVKTKNSKEIFGQVFRIVASLLFTLIWVPKGNTGGTNISPIKTMPIRKELKKYFKV